MINFKEVSFKYKGKEEPSIKNINLRIKEGQCIVLCGRSGCGKTSNTRLLNGLIPDFYQGDLSGVVEIDGRLISNLPIYKISEKVGSVFQNPNTQFFNTDTDSEIAFGIENLSVSEEKLRPIVDKVFCDFKIEKLKIKVFSVIRRRKAKDSLCLYLCYESRYLCFR
ncbi:energy-coupling factor ABC transporter ATP-binding protein [Clostridium botulinum]|nr:energy-coupling factor ABC transporter ATP-binding protein [Clostridium botulinum]